MFAWDKQCGATPASEADYWFSKSVSSGQPENLIFFDIAEWDVGTLQDHAQAQAIWQGCLGENVVMAEDPSSKNSKSVASNNNRNNNNNTSTNGKSNMTYNPTTPNNTSASNLQNNNANHKG